MGVILWCEASLTKPLWITEERTVRGYNYRQHRAVKGQGSVVWTTYVNHCTIVTKERLKVLVSLDQKVSSRIIFFWERLHGQSAAGRWVDPKPQVVIQSELGKPLSLPA